jgi:hypothetical protein
MDKLELLFNGFAQEFIDFEDCLKAIWTIEQDKKIVLNKISFLVIQSFPNDVVIDLTIHNCPIKSTMTPSVILKSIISKKYSLSSGIEKIRNLPSNEYEKSIIVLLFLFKNADIKRRSSFCSSGCTHDWHNYDYSNDNFIKTIKNIYN